MFNLQFRSIAGKHPSHHTDILLLGHLKNKSQQMQNKHTVYAFNAYSDAIIAHEKSKCNKFQFPMGDCKESPRQLELFPENQQKPQISSTPGERHRYRVMLGDEVIGDKLTADEAIELASVKRKRFKGGES